MRRALQVSSGDWGVFLEKPIALVFLILESLSPDAALPVLSAPLQNHALIDDISGRGRSLVAALR